MIAKTGRATVVHLDGAHESRVVVDGRVVARCDCLDSPTVNAHAEFFATAWNRCHPQIVAAAMKVAKAARTPPSWLKVTPGDEGGFWQTKALEDAVEELVAVVEAQEGAK